ncbi:MAG: oxygen-dependent coproporphyrinogen oxidase [Deltaproteobacteria bacterium]|nr:oxygen-dependent coproporphyrinogen oxidase [Deltaproteobacteria bacterium]
MQERYAETLARIDGKARFVADEWAREEGGGGRSMVLADGAVIEKGAVHVSAVYGTMSEAFAKELPGAGRHFYATGVSLIIHPRNPHAPTVHANFRYLEKGDGDDADAWYGGGADLTPYVLYAQDAHHFHEALARACHRHPVADYPQMKKACDDYFRLPHRNEARGIGGIFFDYLGSKDPRRGSPENLDAIEAFVKDAAAAFLDAYPPILERRAHTEFTEAEKSWQLHRRGRYVEFNLVYDRGTIFGLKTGGRIESILASLPPEVRFTYGHKATTPEEKELLDVLYTPRDWLD